MAKVRRPQGPRCTFRCPGSRVWGLASPSPRPSLWLLVLWHPSGASIAATRTLLASSAIGYMPGPVTERPSPMVSQNPRFTLEPSREVTPGWRDHRGDPLQTTSEPRSDAMWRQLRTTMAPGVRGAEGQKESQRADRPQLLRARGGQNTKGAAGFRQQVTHSPLVRKPCQLHLSARFATCWIEGVSVGRSTSPFHTQAVPAAPSMRTGICRHSLQPHGQT